MTQVAIDLFAGCGGLTLGLKQAGFKVIAAVEIDPAAVLAYRENHPEVYLVAGDIRETDPSNIKRALKLRVGQLDLLAGCPPCQGFSRIRTRNARTIRDPRNQLASEFLRYVKVFLPKAVMLENVPQYYNSHPYRRFVAALRKLGYQLAAGVADAADFGVPQRRQRLIMIALRRQMTLVPPARVPHVTVRDAIGSLSAPDESEDELHRLCGKRSEKVTLLIRSIPKDGGSRSSLERSQQLDCHVRCPDGFTDVYGRMAWDRPAPTITGGCTNPSKGRFIHPEQDRAISPREAAILQGFPSTYIFPISLGREAISRMIGNALPPPLIRLHAATIASAVAA